MWSERSEQKEVKVEAARAPADPEGRTAVFTPRRGWSEVGMCSQSGTACAACCLPVSAGASRGPGGNGGSRWAAPQACPLLGAGS